MSDDNLSGLGFELKEKIILTWLCKLWFDIKGDSYGILVKTLENNSTASFFLNDLAWDDLSEFRDFNDKNKRLEPYFTAKPGLLNIFQRVVLKTYPVYPYINKWRHFKKDGDTLKFVSYGNETAERAANASTQIIKEHKTLFDTLKYEQTRTLELMGSGYTEFLPDKPLHDPIYEGAIETRFHSGQHWYYEEQENRLDIKQIAEFENLCHISLPFYFRHYLRLFNGRKYNLINQYFSTGREFLKVREFYNLDELKNQLTSKSPGTFLGSLFNKSVDKKTEWLDIAVLEEQDKKLSLNLSTSKLAIRENNKLQELDVNFENFIKEPRNF